MEENKFHTQMSKKIKHFRFAQNSNNRIIHTLESDSFRMNELTDLFALSQLIQKKQFIDSFQVKTPTDLLKMSRLMVNSTLNLSLNEYIRTYKKSFLRRKISSIKTLSQDMKICSLQDMKSPILIRMCELTQKRVDSHKNSHKNSHKDSQKYSQKYTQKYPLTCLNIYIRKYTMPNELSLWRKPHILLPDKIMGYPHTRVDFAVLLQKDFNRLIPPLVNIVVSYLVGPFIGDRIFLSRRGYLTINLRNESKKLITQIHQNSYQHTTQCKHSQCGMLIVTPCCVKLLCHLCFLDEIHCQRDHHYYFNNLKCENCYNKSSVYY